MTTAVARLTTTLSPFCAFLASNKRGVQRRSPSTTSLITGAATIVLLLLSLNPPAHSQGVCTGLCQQQISCPGPSGPTYTALSGHVYAPNGTDPLPNVLVYIPNSPVLPMPNGVQCGPPPVSGTPLALTYTYPNGSFYLENVPVGSNIPLVIQLGKWRRQFVIPTVSACINNAGGAFAMPANQSQGDIPRIAIQTGATSAPECVVRKVGISDSEFTGPNGGGRVNFFPIDGATTSTNTGGDPGLWSSVNQYDQTTLACLGYADYPDEGEGAGYVNAGGRLVAEHSIYPVFQYSPYFALSGRVFKTFQRSLATNLISPQ